MRITASIEEIVYRNEINGYSVIIADCNGEMLTCVGKFPIIVEGQNVDLTGEFIKDRKYGEQFKVSSVKVLPPNSLDGIIRYLGSGLIKGVGPVTSMNIVAKFKEDTLDIIQYNPQRLIEVKGVSPTKAVQIHEAYVELRNMQNTIMFLQEYDISTNMAVKIFNIYGEKTQKLITENPYRLIEDVDGIGFLSADKIAKKLGIQENSVFRLRAALMHVLKENSDKNGNTYLPKKDLFIEVSKLVKIAIYLIEKLLDEILISLSQENLITLIQEEESVNVMLTRFFKMEKSIASKIISLKYTYLFNKINPETEILNFENKNNIKLHDKQKEAIISSINSGFSVITGGPGTGKTTIVKCLIYLLKLQNKKFCLLAPTGRASKRLSESTNEEASTIHRALELNFKENSTNLFNKNELNPINADTIIVDEVSMVDVTIFYHLLKAVKKGSQVILVGDKDQLPSVGAGNVLSDILLSNTVDVSMLTEIYRQDAKSLIITNAHAINQGEMPILDNSSRDFFFENKTDPSDICDTCLDLVVNRLPSFLNIEPNKIQVLAPMKNAVCGIDNLNKLLQENINPASSFKTEILTENHVFRVGDKVMQISNNYEQEWKRKINDYLTEDGVGVFNGDIGYIEDINLNDNEITVFFEDGRRAIYLKQDLNQLTLSYAITIHKSQGSEFDALVMPIIAGPSMILTKNLLYTGVTRAKKLVVLVGNKTNLKRMVKNNYQALRYSYLKNFLIKEDEQFLKIYNI
ncbi:MAG: ATP-dependent RecD-like DNA helicase [Clostridiales bacterium]|nr:ATP-dependent RecD-like DNA helicase [Clostridiales bacterium]